VPRKVMVGALVLGLAALCAGCASGPEATGTTNSTTTTAPAGVSSSTSTTTLAQTTTTSDTKQLAAEFLALVAPLNASNSRFSSDLNSNTTQAQAETDAQPLIVAARSFDNALLRMGLTGQAETDARALVAADSALIADLNDLGTTVDLSTWETQSSHDGAAQETADNELRADLGLPPATQPTG
jgi:hypothetical protein